MNAVNTPTSQYCLWNFSFVPKTGLTKKILVVDRDKESIKM